MSSYHIINAIWVGVFPMLAVTVVIGIVCYLLCCLNQIKIKFNQHKKRQALKEEHRRMLKEREQHQPTDRLAPNSISISVTSVDKVVTGERPTSSGRIGGQDKLSHGHVKLSSAVGAQIRASSSNASGPLLHQVENVYVPPSVRYNVENERPLTATASSASVSAVQRPSSFNLPLYKPYTVSSYDNLSNANTNTRTADDVISEVLTCKLDDPESPIEQLIVEELNESPKSLYSKFRNFARNDQQSTDKRDVQRQKLNEIKKSDKHAKSSNTESAKLTRSTMNDSTSDINTDSGSRANDTGDDTANDYDDDDESDNENDSSNDRMRAARPNLHLLSKNPLSNLNKDPVDKNQLQKLKLLELSQNRASKILSDIDMEDDLIFADDDDSLSSTGLCTATTTKRAINPLTGATTATGRYKLHANNNPRRLDKKKLLLKISPINESDHSHKIKIPGDDIKDHDDDDDDHNDQLKLATNKNKPPSSHSQSNTSSMSDIEPDENILNNLLIKTPDKKNKSGEKK